MREISKIDIEQLEFLSSFYTEAENRFGVEPDSAPVKLKKKIKKWIVGTYKNNIQFLSDDIQEELSIMGADEFLWFLKKCHESYSGKINEKANSAEQICKRFPEDVKSALLRLAESYDEFFINAKRSGNDIIVMLENTISFVRYLTLKNAEGFSEKMEGEDSMLVRCDLKFMEESGKYYLCGKYSDIESEEDLDFSISFETAEVEVKVFNAMETASYYDSPFSFIEHAADAIIYKSELVGEYCNAAELSLLPLLKEISALGGMDILSENKKDFPLFKDIAGRYGFKKIVSLLEKFEKIRSKKNAGTDFTLWMDFEKEIARKKYEPMCRELYGKILESQREYPLQSEMMGDREKLENTRSDILRLMREHGYSGNYPDFTKEGEIKGVRLETSYNKSYFIGIKKRAVFHIHCFEEAGDDGSLTVRFLCGTELLKKSEEPGDFYSCMFNAGGRRLFKTFDYYSPSDKQKEPEMPVTSDIELSVGIAAKKAECRRLNKEEKKVYYGSLNNGPYLFLAVFIFLGGLFGVGMTFFAILGFAITDICLGNLEAVVKDIQSFPWYVVLIVSWVLFGGIMGILETLVHRK